MRYANRLSVVAAAIAAVATAVLLLFGGRSSDATIYVPEPSIPPDCFVSDAPTANGPSAPTDLTAEWSPYFQPDGFLLDAFDVVRWTDNSDDETCFIVEMKSNQIGATYEVVAILPSDSESFSPFSGPGWRTYRVYAAHAEGRSGYSNSDQVRANYTPPKPPGQLRADLNCDGSIDPRDSLELLRVDAGLDLDVPIDCLAPNADVDWEITYFPIFRRADLNCDESIDPRDSLVILRDDAGLDLNLPVLCLPPDAEVWLA